MKDAVVARVAGQFMSGPSPLYGGTGGTSIGDHLLNIYGKINTMESNIAAMKAQTDKLTFDGSSHLEVHTN